MSVMAATTGPQGIVQGRPFAVPCGVSLRTGIEIVYRVDREWVCSSADLG